MPGIKNWTSEIQVNFYQIEESIMFYSIPILLQLQTLISAAIHYLPVLSIIRLLGKKSDVLFFLLHPDVHVSKSGQTK